MYAATLDLKKGFDSVNHLALYESLLTAGIPFPLVNFIRCWYNKLFVVVGWNGCRPTSECFQVTSRVRQLRQSDVSFISSIPSLMYLFVNWLYLMLVVTLPISF